MRCELLTTVCTAVLFIHCVVMLSSPQAAIYKLDFEQERKDRGQAMGRFDDERVRFQQDIATMAEKMKNNHLERDKIATQLEQLKEVVKSQKKEVRI